MGKSKDIDGPILRLFISYSRADTAFVDEVVEGLELVGNFEILLDRHSIASGEKWRERLAGLIEESDVAVFILSPDFVASDVCGWEVAHAGEHGKRLVPVLIAPIDDAKVPEALRAINYVDATKSNTLIATIKALGQTLQMDLAWLREGTRLMSFARDWDSEERPDNRLLLAGDVASAERWLSNPPQGAQITDLQREFIAASSAAFALQQDAEQQRLAEVAEANKRAAVTARRGRFVAISLACAAVLLAVFAGYFWSEAQESAAAARLTALDAGRATASAVSAQEHAIEEAALAENSERRANAAEVEAKLARQDAEQTALKAETDLQRAYLTAQVVLSGRVSEQRPSFSCADFQRLRLDEIALCFVPKLAVADTTMARLYSQLRQTLSEEGKSILRLEQLDWLRQRQQCVNSSRADTLEERADKLISCVQASVAQRIAELERQDVAGAGE
jgi:hypothetical protein